MTFSAFLSHALGTAEYAKASERGGTLPKCSAHAISSSGEAARPSQSPFSATRWGVTNPHFGSNRGGGERESEEVGAGADSA